MYYECIENHLYSLSMAFTSEYHKQTGWSSALNSRGLGSLQGQGQANKSWLPLSDLKEAVLWLSCLPTATAVYKHRKLFSEDISNPGSGPSPPDLILTHSLL